MIHNLPERTKILNELKKVLSKLDYAHCLRTEKTAIDLAKCFSVDKQKASTAALLHDYARHYSDKEMIRKAREYDIPITDADLTQPYLLHGRIGAKEVQTKFSDIDPEIVNAINVHTYGCPDMTKLDMILYLADSIEPGRATEGLENIRIIAKVDLTEAFKQAYESSIIRLIKQKRVIHPSSVTVWNRYVALKRVGF